MDKILIINAGSSSIKLSLLKKANLELIASGLAERIGLESGRIIFKFKKTITKVLPIANHDQGIKEFLKIFHEEALVENLEEISHIGFRVVMGGPNLRKSVLIDEKVLQEIEKYAPFAPVHNPGALETIRACQKALPKAQQSASFDTAFHTTIPDFNSQYAIPQDWQKKHKIKKYGFHGLSHFYITEELKKLLQKEKVNFVNLHIGNGASLCAIKNSQSFDTSMGLTPLAGVVMGTRSGDLDPAVIAFIAQAENLSAAQIVDILNKQSGLLGLSGVSSDLRDINEAIAKENAQAILAHQIYVKASVDYLINYLNKIGPQIDAIVFTAGVGENDDLYRQAVIDGIKILKVELDPEKNRLRSKEKRLISSANSSIPVYVIPTNEELVIAQDALKLS